MRDLLPQLKQWLDAGQPFALATVISTWGSAPRRVGSNMAIRHDQAILGSVSGGCVEGVVIEQAAKVLKTGKPELLHFGVSDETAWDVGLACGGEIDVYVQPAVPTILNEIIARIEQEEYVAYAFPLDWQTDGNHYLLDAQGIGYPQQDSTLTELQAAQNVSARKPRILEDVQGIRFFFNPMLPSPQLVIIGGVQIAQALTQLARLMHFHPIIIDPRKAFLTPERFPETEDYYQEWPGQAFEKLDLGSVTAVVSLTHDPKIDDPALLGALSSSAFYVGALGSRKTHAKRLERLEAAGASPEALARIHAPIGLDIKATNPEEIALAIMAQVVAVYRS